MNARAQPPGSNVEERRVGLVAPRRSAAPGALARASAGDRRRARSLILVAGLLLLTGCSSFNRDWKRVVASPAGTAPGAATAWEGEWRSAASSHHGRLRAIVTPVDPERLHLRFRAAFGGILRSGHALEVSLQPGPAGTNTFAGREKLGLWGTYRFEGGLSTNTMEVHYWVYYDHGMFHLRRIEPPPTPTLAP